MIDPLNWLKLRTLGIGALSGAAVGGGVYLVFTQRVDFYEILLVGTLAGASIHGVLRYVFGPRAKHRRLETNVLRVKVLRETGFIDREEAQEIIDELVETSFVGKRRPDSDK